MWNRKVEKEELEHRHKEVKQNPEQAHMKTTTENEKGNIKVCVSFLSPHNHLFLSVYLKRLTHFLYSVFSFSKRVVANKLCIKQTNREGLYICHFFLTERLQ